MAMRALHPLLGLLLVSLVAAAPLVAAAQPLQNRSQVISTVSSTTDGNIPCFEGTGGKRIKDCGAASGLGVPSSRTISTTSPLGGGGDLSANRTLTCATCVTAASTFGFDDVLVRSDGTDRGTQATGLVVDDSNLLGLGLTPTHALTLPASSTGLAIYNVAGTERLVAAWSGNVFSLLTEANGGTARNFTSGTAASSITASGSVGGFFALNGSSGGHTQVSPASSNVGLWLRSLVSSSTTTAGVRLVGNSTAFTASSGSQTPALIDPDINQSGTAGYTALRVNVTESGTGSGTKLLLSTDVGGASRFSVSAAGTLQSTGSYVSSGSVQARATTAIPAGGLAGNGVTFFSTANFGVFGGSGPPTLSAAKGSLYLRSDGTTTNDRMYVNTDGGTTWTAVITAL